ncbi:MAG: hemolysin family protein [Isosphaeraceae bacterium]
MQSLIGGILVVLGLIAARGILTTAEIALGSARKSRLRGRASRGDRGAEAAIQLGEDPKGFAPTVQAGITLLAVLAGVYGGATLGPDVCRAIGQDGPLGPYGKPIGIGLVALGITAATLVLGEFAPRRVALHWPERIAGLVARPIRALATVTNPIVGLLSAATDLALRAVGMRPKPELPVTEEEIQVLMREGTKAGVFEEAEREMVKRVLRFGDRRARSLMTPRNEIVWIDAADPPEEIRRKVVHSPHSRFPVCDQSLDNLLGIVHVKDLLGQGQNLEPFRFKGRLTLPLFLYEGTHGLKILEMFKTSATHSAVVLDEYGTVEGLLTLTDILHAIVGDMPESAEDEQPASVRQPDGSWLLHGRMPLDEFRDLFEQAAIPEGDFHTLAGFVVAQLGHIPRVEEGLDYAGLHFEVVEMDGNRVDRIRVKPIVGDGGES